MSSPLLVAVEICPLCSRTRRRFTCASCVTTGSFFHCNKSDDESFRTKEEKLRALRDAITLTSKRVEVYHKQRSEFEVKKLQFIAARQRVNSLKDAVAIAKEFRDQDQKDISLLKDRHVTVKRRLNRVTEQLTILREECSDDSKNVLKLKVQNCLAVQIMSSFLSAKNEARIEKVIDRSNRIHLEELSQGKQIKLAELLSELKLIRKRRIGSLINNIFPIFTRPVYQEFGTPPQLTIFTQTTSSDVISEASFAAESELEEATRTEYEGGRWVQQMPEETDHCIIEAGLPTSGDYYKYYEWLKSQRNEPRGPDSGLLHTIPALGIPAALTYTAQLVEIVSFFLDVNLPRRLDFAEFSDTQLSRKKFFDIVSRLNINVMHLCFSQGIYVEAVNPTQVLKNLEICLSQDNSELGRTCAFETFQFALPDCPFDSDSSAEELLFDSDSESDASEKEDWDRLADLPDMPKDVSDMEASSSTSRTSPRDQSLSTSASGLVTSAAASVAALWPWKKQQ